MCLWKLGLTGNNPINSDTARYHKNFEFDDAITITKEIFNNLVNAAYSETVILEFEFKNDNTEE